MQLRPLNFIKNIISKIGKPKERVTVIPSENIQAQKKDRERRSVIEDQFTGYFRCGGGTFRKRPGEFK